MAYIEPEESVFGVSLFERLDTDVKPISLSQGPNTLAVLRSIKRNISNILNTRLGESQSSPNLGLVDFNDASMTSLDLSVQFKRSIKFCLEHFEPRLSQVEVVVFKDESDLLNLRFGITAVINTSAIHEKVKIELLLDNNKKYRVMA